MKQARSNNRCRHCAKPVNGNYCAHCGRATRPERIDGRYLIREIADTLGLNRQLWHTLKGLLFRPGETVRHYITTDRSSDMKPIAFLLFTSCLYTLVCYTLGSRPQELPDGSLETETLLLFFQWLQVYSGYANILIGVVVAFFVRWFFRRSGYCFAELFVLLCFVFGIEMLIDTLCVIIQSVVPVSITAVSGAIVILYFTWAVGRFFAQSKAYIGALSAYLSGTLVFAILMILVAFVVDGIFR
ncbi:MAG: DUF3667 domain-containing protein [Prevotellaceae bacterium]|nr:DUF3667 domain-containing protein [Prevotellaceae bacterium]